MKIVVINNVSLDGVMQAPGRADEDPRGAFAYGGWATTYTEQPDPEIAAAIGARMAESDGLLLGRRTYEDLLSTWTARGGMFKEALNSAQKYVVSRTLPEPLPWPNSTLLAGDVIGSVTDLKSRSGRELHIMGSGQLIETLVAHDLIDEFHLTIFPIVLGSGRRLFSGETHLKLDLMEAKGATSGAVLASYRRST